MKILIVTESFPPHAGGSGWSTFTLCKALRKGGHDVFVAKIGSTAYTYEGFEVLPLKLPRVPAALQALFSSRLEKQVHTIVKKYSIEVVHAQHMLSALASGRNKAKKILTLRDYWPLCYKGTLFRVYSGKICTNQNTYNCLKCTYFENGLLVKVFSPFLVLYLKYRTWKGKKALHKMDTVICVSDYVKKHMKGKVPHYVSLPNMLDPATVLIKSP